MPKYLSLDLGYTTYVRSAQPSAFVTFDKPEVALCWIDLLGVSQMNHAQIVHAVETALLSASEASSTGNIAGSTLIGTPDSAFQYCLVGDALIIAEKDFKDTPAAATLALLYRVNILSRLLNERGLLHRGVITNAPVKCFKFEDSSVITGEGIVKAVGLEKTLKAAGLFYDEKVAGFINWRQSGGQKLEKQTFYVPFNSIPNWNSTIHAPGLAGVSFTQYKGWEFWKQIVSKGNQANNKIINATSLIAEIKSTYQLQ